MRALIIGDIDFLGFHVGKTLSDLGYDISFVGRIKGKSPAYKVGEVINTSISNDYGIKAAFNKLSPDIVLFNEFPGNNVVNNSELKTYTEALRILNEALFMYGCEHLYFRSSCDVYGSSGGVNKYKLKESDLCQPINYRGVHCKFAEDLFRVHCYLNKIKFTSLRVFELYGNCLPEKSEKSILQNAIFFLYSNRGVGVNGPNRFMDFIHVEDAAVGMSSIINSKMCGPINVASGNSVKLWTVLNAFSKIIDKKGSLMKIEGEKYYFSSCADVSKSSSLFSVEKVLEEEMVSMYNYFKGCR